MKKIRIYLPVVAMLLLTAGCSDWTQMEPVDQQPVRPSEQNPELWAQYTAALRAYKASDHTLVVASFENGSTTPTSEKDCLRSLPDSLDAVSLTNADNFSAYDAEDLAVLKEKGTRVLYFVDYAARSGEWPDLAALTAYLDGVVARVQELNLDGFSFSGLPSYGDEASQAAQQAVAALFIEKFGAVAGPDKPLTLFFEGDPQFLTADQRAKVDYIVLDTRTTDNASDLKLQVLRALEMENVAADRLLLGAMTEYEFLDEEKTASDAISALALRIPELGPLGGLCIYDVNTDYYGSEVVYAATRTAIQTLNPAK